jgi:hypothetical protein
MLEEFEFVEDVFQLDQRLIETALACGPDRELLLEAIRTGNWSCVTALPEPANEAA